MSRYRIKCVFFGIGTWPGPCQLTQYLAGVGRHHDELRWLWASSGEALTFGSGCSSAETIDLVRAKHPRAVREVDYGNGEWLESPCGRDPLSLSTTELAKLWAQREWE